MKAHDTFGNATEERALMVVFNEGERGGEEPGERNYEPTHTCQPPEG
jgi:hypothetical protein